MDIDLFSVKKTAENCALNQCRFVSVSQADILNFKPVRQYDVVIANVLTVVILEALSTLVSVVAPNGFLVLSGIGIQWRQDVIEAVQATGFNVVESWEKDGWVCLVSTERNG